MPKCVGLICSLAVLACGSAWADDLQVQTTMFSFTQSGTSTGNFTIVADGDFSTGNTIVPFDPTLGQLVSFTVDWNISFDANGMTETDAGGGFGGSAGGDYQLAGTPYDSNGGGNDNGAPPDQPVSFTFGVDQSDSFQIPDTDYDPAILAAVTGDSDFALYWDTGYTLNVGDGIASWTADANGTAAITYDYVPVPEPPSLVLLLTALPVLWLGHRFGRRSRPGAAG